jgi:hypothetical protein
MNDHWVKAATAIFISGALLGVEVFGESKAHASYNVSELTLTVGNANVANANVSAFAMIGPGPVNYKTGAAVNLFLQAKG